MIKADPEKYYGKTVTGYLAASSSLDKEWQIFHSDGSHIYLISKGQIYYNNQDDIVDNDECPNLPNGQVTGNKGYSDTKYTEGIGLGNVVEYYSGASDISSTNPVYDKLKYIKSNPTSTTGASKVIAFMVDQNVWKTYIGTNAEYAIGGPNIIQFIESYNSVPHEVGKEKMYWELSGVGYKLSFDNINFDVAIKGNIEEYNKLYYGTNISEVHGVRLASPIDNYSDIVMLTTYDRAYIGNYWFSRDAYTFRPLVCLKSGVTLEKNGDGFIIK